MFDDSYDNYMRSILGYPNTQSMPYNNDMSYNMGYSNTYMPNMNTINTETEDFYPEIYKIVYPMILKSCRGNSNPVTKDLVENMTDEIYSAIEGESEIMLNINLNNPVTSAENRNTPNSKIEQSRNKIQDSKGESRRMRNTGLRDLIKILLIRELFGRPTFPQRPPKPPRPPMGRPPYPRDYNMYESNYDIYEY